MTVRAPCRVCGTPAKGVCPRCGTPGALGRRERQRLHGRDRAEWRNLTRPAVLARDGYRCRMSLPSCTVTATTVHRLRGFGAFHDGNLAAYVAACAHCNASEGATAA